MTNHVPGSGASVNGTSYANPQGPASQERWTYGILALLEQEENNLPKTPKRTDKISIEINLSTKVATSDLILNVVAAIGSNGIIYTATDYLTGSTFTSGTGGDSNAQNLAQAAMEAVILLKLLELDKSRRMNPEKTVITRCQHVIAASGSSNATFSATLEFPIKILSLPGGGSLIEGKEFLT